jgi:alkylated DNA nucleotide flippase Atl1
MGLNITMQKVQAYRVFGDRIVVTVSQQFPVQDVEEFTVSPQRAQAQVSEQRRRTTREKSTVHKLVAAKAIPDGTVLTLRPNNEVTEEIREALERWIAEDPRRGRAVWFNRLPDPLQWEADGETYRPTPLAAQMLAEAADVSRSPRGPSWWVLPDGRDLTTAAGAVSGGVFDWSLLHRVMSTLPAGRWTTYGDLADLIGTAAQPLGLHIARCPDCMNAHRVLGADGRVRPNFTWTDPADNRKPEDLLADEGVEVRDGVADAATRLTPAELTSLSRDVGPPE